jgi:hypothetical protein
MTESKLTDLLEEAFVRCRDLEVPLAGRLQAYADEVRALGPHFQTAIDALVSRLAQTNAGARLLRWVSRCRRSCCQTNRDGPSDSRIFLIVGTDGIVRARFVDPDYRTRMAIEDMLAALRSATQLVFSARVFVIGPV